MAVRFVTLMPMKIRRFIPAVLVSLALSATSFAASSATRPALWAVAVEKTSVPNLYRVESDLYRSGSPGAAGFKELAALGVKSVLDVESPGDDAAARGTGVKVFHVPMTAWGLRDERVLQALKILADPANRPIVIHCHLGADRTGAMMALYRVVVQGWSKDDAIREMDDGGYHHSSWFRNLDRYVAGADVDVFRKALKITKPAATLAAALGQVATPAVSTVTTAAADVATAVKDAVSGANDSAPAARTADASAAPAASAPGAVSTGSPAPAALKTADASTSSASHDR